MARGDPGEAGYTPQVQPEDLPRKIMPRAEPGPVGPALSHFGDALSQKYQADSAAWAGDQLAQFRLKAVQSLEAQKAATPAGQDPGNFTEKYLASFDKDSSPLVDTSGGNPFARQMVEKGLGDLRNTLASHTMEWEAQQRVAYRTDSIKQNLTSQLPIVEAHPELAAQVGSTLMDQINANGADPSTRLLLGRQMHAQLSEAAANGLARQDPRGTIEALNDPDHAPAALRGLTDQQIETIRSKANSHLSDGVFSSLTNNDLAGAQGKLDANKDIMDPNTAWGLQRTIDGQVKEKQNEAKQDIADRFQDSMQAAQFGLPNPITVSRQEMDVLYPKDAQRRWDGLQSMVETGAQAREYDHMTPQEIQADLQKRTPTQGGPEATFQIHNYETLARAADQSLKARAKDPAQFAIDSGTGWTALDPNDPKGMLDELRSRANSAQTVSEQVGGPVPLLTKPESRQMSTTLNNAPPAQRVQLLEGLHQSLPDDRAYFSLLQQIAPHSPVTAIVGAKVGQPYPTHTPLWYDQKFGANPADAQRILAGEALLNPATKGTEEKGGFKGGFPMPPEGGGAGLQSYFANQTKDLFRNRPELADAYYSTFRAAYAGLASEKGDYEGQLNTSREKQAYQMAIGHTLDFNGQQVMVPPGMDPTRFKGLVANAVEAAGPAYGAPPDWRDKIGGFQLRELGGVGSGQYQLLNGNMPIVVKGKPFTIDLHGQYQSKP